MAHTDRWPANQEVYVGCSTQKSVNPSKERCDLRRFIVEAVAASAAFPIVPTPTRANLERYPISIDGFELTASCKLAFEFLFFPLRLYTGTTRNQARSSASSRQAMPSQKSDGGAKHHHRKCPGDAARQLGTVYVEVRGHFESPCPGKPMAR
jgi:hypothetical protein